jgi:Spy/CpxP family protein refolding chaperone
MKLVLVSLMAGALFVGQPEYLHAQRRDGGPPNPRREALERQLRERTGDVVRRRLNLTDAQMTRLQATNRQFERDRMDLFSRERQARVALRQEMMNEESANQARVAELIDQTLTLERQRIELLQNEQKELAKFLTPIQRAKLIGLQNQMRRRAQDMRGPPR